MRNLVSFMIAGSMVLAASNALAQDSMQKKDGMTGDLMNKEQGMSPKAKPKRAKKDQMKDSMGHEAMGKDSMGKDSMPKDSMRPDPMGSKPSSM
jgi:hypothetical protein